MLIPAPCYRDLREEFRRGDHAALLGTAQRTLEHLDGDESQRGLVPAALLMVGASLASVERPADATAYLTQGLATLAGTASQREVGEGDWYELVLLDLLLAQGRFADAWPRIQRLIEPGQRTETRLGATRAQVSLTTTFGDFATAQQLLNTAAGLAERARNRLLGAVVEADRASVLAVQGRTVEATVFADRVLPDLVRPGPGPTLAWASSQAVALATTLARSCAVVGDLMTAERMMFLADGPATRSGRSFDRAQLALARSVVSRQGGHLDDAEAPVLEARRRFLELGFAPAAAMAQREEANLAAARGLLASARPLFERARDEFAVLGLTHEVARIEARLRA